MKKKVLSILLVSVLALSLLTGCGTTITVSDGETAKEEADTVKEEAQEEADLSTLTFGEFDWPVEPSIDFTQPYAKRFDGLDFTWIVNTGSNEPPEGQTTDENTKVWGFESATGLNPVNLWTSSGDAYTQKQNQAIASGEIPDLMKVGINQYKMLVKSGLVADLTDELMNGDHPTLKKLYEAGDNAALKALEVDGRIYGIPRVNTQFDGSPVVWIRKDWMDKLGLQAPESLDDLAEIARTFMAADIDGNGNDDTYGIPVLPSFDASYGGDGSLCDIFLNVGGAAPKLWQEQEDGTVIYGSLMEGAKEALTFLNGWYEEGLIPSDFATWDADTLKQAVGDGKTGIAFSPWWGIWGALNNSLSLDENAEWCAFMLPKEKGGKIRSAAGNPVADIFVVRADFEQPEAFVYAYDLWNSSAMKFTSYPDYVETNNVYNPMTCSVSPQNVYLLGKIFAENIATSEATTEEGKGLFLEAAGVQQDVNFDRMEIAKAVFDASEAGETAPRTVAAEGQDETTTYQHYLQWIIGPGAIYNAAPEAVSTLFQGTTESMELYSTFLSDYEQESYVKMIMGDTDGMSISDYFDAFVENYLAQGGEVITAEVAEAIGK